MNNDPDLQRQLVRDRHDELRRVAGRTRLRRETRRNRQRRRDLDQT